MRAAKGIGTKMDSGASRFDYSDHDLKLASCKLAFDHGQLQRINRKFDHLLSRKNDSGREKTRRTAYLNVVVERLVQRLICNVGKFDSRFSSAFLINLDPSGIYDLGPRKIMKFKYMVRLDLISSPALYPEVFQPPLRVTEGTDDDSVPQGYAKIRVHGEFLEKWMGFISSSGFLRRDKIQERFIELLARAAAKPTEPLTPATVDESRHCGSPGKVVDPITLYYILRTPARRRFFFGSAECNESRFPDPRDFRIAIVEGVPEIRLHISFLSPAARSISAEDAQVSIVLGIGVAGWPASTDFPFRLPLDHVDVILAYQAAQLDYYLVPKGPHGSIYCEDRLSAWEIRPLASEMFLLHHYSPTSVIFRVYKILICILDILKARGVKTINRYILNNCLFFELEVQKDMLQWAPQLTAQRVLSILDRLLLCLRCHNFPSYIFTGKNLLLQDDVFEDDFASDGDILENYLKLLHADGSHFDQTETFSDPSKDLMENILLRKWKDVISDMLPPMSNRSCRLSVVNNSSTHISYTSHQIDYIALLLRQVLNIKKMHKEEEQIANGRQKDIKPEEVLSGDFINKEDFIYLLQMIFDQAKQKLFSSMTSKLVKEKRKGNLLKLDQTIMGYDISTSLLIDDIRRTEDDHYRFPDDTSIVVKVLEHLYKAIDSDRKVLGRVLKPYLNQLFKGSHENCWFLPEWEKRNNTSEIQAMDAFGYLILSEKIDPLLGILNAASKGWNWAISTLQILRIIMKETSTRIIVGTKIDTNDSGLRLIFTPEPGKTVRINVALTKASSAGYTAEEPSGGTDRQATIKSFQDVLGSLIASENLGKNCTMLVDRQAPHLLLRDGNPFTVASMEIRRQGNHRGLGSIVQALISLQKLTILQEVSQYLPEKERTRVLNDIKKLSKEIQRLSIENHKKNYFSRAQRKKNRFSFKVPKIYWNTTQKQFSLFYHVSKSPARDSRLLQFKHNPNDLQKSTESLILTNISFKSTKRKTIKQTPQETYRSRDEFAPRENYTFSPSKSPPENSNNGDTCSKKETLLDTCRLIRTHLRSNLFDRSMANLNTLPAAVEGTTNRASFAPSKSIINTPFYIRVSSWNSKDYEGTSAF